MKSRIPVLAALAALMAASPAPAQRAARGPKYAIKLATRAPEGSAWMRRFELMNGEVLEATGGEVGFKVYPGGVLGEEKDVLFKIKVGQVDGGGFMGFGVTEICPDADAMMQPLQFETYAEVDAVFQALRPHLEAQCRKNGFEALGWTEIGFSYAYSAVPVRSLQDLRGAKPWLLPGSDTVEALFRKGSVSGIPIPVGDVLTALQTGLVRTVFAPPYAAVAAQWFTRVRYRTDARILYSLGGILVALRAWEKIPEAHRAAVLEITRRHMAELSRDVRRSDAEALDVMAGEGVETVTTTDEDMREFVKVSREVTAESVGRRFSAEAHAIVTARLADLRAAEERADRE